MFLKNHGNRNSPLPMSKTLRPVCNYLRGGNEGILGDTAAHGCCKIAKLHLLLAKYYTKTSLQTSCQKKGHEDLCINFHLSDNRMLHIVHLAMINTNEILIKCKPLAYIRELSELYRKREKKKARTIQKQKQANPGTIYQQSYTTYNTHTHTHTHMHVHAHTHTHTHKHARAHTYTYTHRPYQVKWCNLQFSKKKWRK